MTERGFALALGGVSSGLLAAFAGSRWIASFLYGVTATDALTYLALSGLLGGVCLLASYLPARRASVSTRFACFVARDGATFRP